MRTVTIFFLAWLLLCAASVNGVCGEKEATNKQLADLNERLKILEETRAKILITGQRAEIEAQEIFQLAADIAKENKPELSCEEAVIVFTSMYYKELLTRLSAELAIIDIAIHEIQEEIAHLRQRQEAVRKGVKI